MRKSLIRLLLIFGLVLLGCSKNRSPFENGQPICMTLISSHLDHDAELILSLEENCKAIDDYNGGEIFSPIIQDQDTLGKRYLGATWIRLDSQEIINQLYIKSQSLEEFDQSRFGIIVLFEMENGRSEKRVVTSEQTLEEYLDSVICTLTDNRHSDVLLYFLTRFLWPRGFTRQEVSSSDSFP